MRAPKSARVAVLLARPAALASVLCLTACSQWLFSGDMVPANDRPVMRIETRGGSEMGVGTDAGILFLARTAKEGACRVHYWLGPTPLVEDGVIEPWGGVFYRASIDLRHQSARFLDRDLNPDEPLIALVHVATGVDEVALQRAREPGIEGDVVAWPGRNLPAGTGVFVRDERGLALVGLIAGSIETAGTRYLVHTGTTSLREALLVAKPHRLPRQVKHRPDDITIDK